MIIYGIICAWVSVLMLFGLILIIRIMKVEWKNRSFFDFVFSTLILISTLMILTGSVLLALQNFGIL